MSHTNETYVSFLMIFRIELVSRYMPSQDRPTRGRFVGQPILSEVSRPLCYSACFAIATNQAQSSEKIRELASQSWEYKPILRPITVLQGQFLASEHGKLPCEMPGGAWSVHGTQAV